jgi:hypothetical protein
MNEAVTAQSKIIAGQSDTLIKSLARSVPFVGITTMHELTRNLAIDE